MRRCGALRLRLSTLRTLVKDLTRKVSVRVTGDAFPTSAAAASMTVLPPSKPGKLMPLNINHESWPVRESACNPRLFLT